MYRTIAGLGLCIAACSSIGQPADQGTDLRRSDATSASDRSATVDVADSRAVPDTKASMCASSATCVPASVSDPSGTTPASSPTSCVQGRCGLVTGYYGSYATPKTPRSCDDICASSTYEGRKMVCHPSCRTGVINGFGDKSLFFEPTDAGAAGTLGGLATYQFSTISGAYRFVTLTCNTVPTSKLVEGSNSYKYVAQRCCCVGTPP